MRAPRARAAADCGLPPEFCENGVKFESCKPWLRAHAAHLYPALVAPPAGAGASGVAPAGDAAPGSAASVDAAADRIAALTVKDRDGDSGSDDGSGDDDEGAAPKKKGASECGRVCGRVRACGVCVWSACASLRLWSARASVRACSQRW